MIAVDSLSSLSLKHDYAFLLVWALLLVTLRPLIEGRTLELADYTIAISDLLLAHSL